MNNSALFAWYALADLAVPKFVAVESAALVILAAGLLVFRTFRERYLLIWILGWLAYFVSNWTIHHPGVDPNSRYAIAISQSQFVLALCMFSAAVFVYSHARKVLGAAAGIFYRSRRLRGGKSLVVAGFVRSARGARGFLPGRYFRRCSSIDTLSLGALGDWPLALESHFAGDAPRLGSGECALAARVQSRRRFASRPEHVADGLR